MANKKYNAAEIRARVKAGFCRFKYCKEEKRENKTTCKKHGELVSRCSINRQKKIIEVCKASNIPICSRCLKENDRHKEGKSKCSSCKKKSPSQRAAQRARWREQGKCSCCGKKRDNKKLLTCKNCRIRSPKQKKDNNERRKQEKIFALTHGKCSTCFKKRVGADKNYKNCKPCRAVLADRKKRWEAKNKLSQK